jgi:hypothetical protein
LDERGATLMFENYNIYKIIPSYSYPFFIGKANSKNDNVIYKCFERKNLYKILQFNETDFDCYENNDENYFFKNLSNFYKTKKKFSDLKILI